MKTSLLRFFVILCLSFTVASAHEKITTGPHGGRVLTTVQPRAEFYVTAERKIQITFLDAAGKPVAPADQIVTVTTGKRAAPTTLTFVKSGDTLLSETALPAGNGFPTVVQIKTSPEAKPTLARFNLNTETCSSCKNPEYACTCGH
jgi:hypothetical protein